LLVWRTQMGQAGRVYSAAHVLTHCAFHADAANCHCGSVFLWGGRETIVLNKLMTCMSVDLEGE
jgi:hypothetical protein